MCPVLDLPCPDSVGTHRVRAEPELRLGIARVAQAGAETLTAIPELNDLEEVPAGLFSAGKSASGGFALQRAVEPFDHGDAVSIAGSTYTHARADRR